MVEVECRQDFGAGKCSADVSRFAPVHHAQHMRAVIVGAAREIGHHGFGMVRPVRDTQRPEPSIVWSAPSRVHLGWNGASIQRAANEVESGGAAVVDGNCGFAQEWLKRRHGKLGHHNGIDFAR